MSVYNKMPNVSITHMDEEGSLNLGYIQNRRRQVTSKVTGSSTTVGDHGINLDFENNLYIYKKTPLKRKGDTIV